MSPTRGGRWISQAPPQGPGEVKHCGGAACAHVKHLSLHLLAAGSQPQGFHQIPHIQEIPRLKPILEDLRGSAASQESGEDRTDPGIGVGEGLPRPVGQEKPQRHGGKPPVMGQGDDEPLAEELGESVGSAGGWRSFFRRGQGVGRTGTAWAGRLPATTADIFVPPYLRLHGPVAWALVEPFPVHRLGGSVHDLWAASGGEDFLYKQRRPPAIYVHIRHKLILKAADGGQVEYDVHPPESVPDSLRLPDVRSQEFGPPVDPGWSAPVGRRRKVIQDLHLPALPDQSVHEMGADEARAAGDQGVHGSLSRARCSRRNFLR